MKLKAIPFYLILFGFFLSGLAALGYQQLWIRLITLFFGHTTFAISAVIGIFMMGLALGSYCASRYIRKGTSRNPLIMVVALQTLIGGYGILSEPLIRFAHTLVANTGLFDVSLIAQNSVWFAVSCILLILPTSMMGASLPLLSQWVVRTKQETGDRVSVLYGVNTAGAVAGIVLYGFVIIKHSGISNGLFFASGASILSALMVFAAFRLTKDTEGTLPEETISEPVSAVSLSHYAVLCMLFFSGFAGMVCEIVWARVFAVLFGSSTYSFTLVLALFLAGLSLGSLVFQIIRRFAAVTLGKLVSIELSIAVLLLLFMPLYPYLPYILFRLSPYIATSFTLFIIVEFFIIGFVMLLPTFLMGLSFPWAIEVLSSSYEKAGSLTGRCFTANTLGSICGSLIAGFFWLPVFGMQRTLISAAVLYVLAALIIWFFSARAEKILIAAITALVMAVLVVMPAWNQRSLSSGMYLYAPAFPRWVDSYAAFLKFLNPDKVLYYKDGLTSSIAVLESPWGERYLRTNGKSDASLLGDMATQMLLGYIPYLFHSESPRKALVIGLGSGMTASALASFSDVEHIDCLEIEPAVTEAAAYFSIANRHILLDKRLRLILTDARHFLAMRTAPYDLIVSEPSNPWISGIANLYTKEAFELGKNKLADGGIFCQWLHSYAMSEKDFKMIIKTFVDVFPDTMLLNPQSNDYLLVGSREPLRIDLKKITDAYKNNLSFSSDVERMGYAHPLALLANIFVLQSPDLQAYVHGSVIHRDDKPTLEFSAPMSLYSKDDGDIARSLAENRRDILPTHIVGNSDVPGDTALVYNVVGESFMHNRNPQRAEECFLKVLSAQPNNVRGIINLGRVYNAYNQHLKAEEMFKEAITREPQNALAYFHLGMLYAVQGMDEKGLGSLIKGLEFSPQDPMGSLQAAKMYMKRGEKKRAHELLLRALSVPIHNEGLRKSLEKQLQEIE